MDHVSGPPNGAPGRTAGTGVLPSSTWKASLARLLPATALLLTAATAHAACTNEDVAAIVAGTEEAHAALRAGSPQRYVLAMKASNARVPADCRPVLDRLQPMATRCTAEEQRFAMDVVKVTMQAAATADWRRMLAAYDLLERTVTPRCWIAVNLRTEPDVVLSCRPAELEGLAALAGPVIRATGRAAATGDVSGLLQVLGAMPAFTPQCAAAIQRHAPPAGPGGQARPGPPGGVNDHGNGLYSVPGVGACGPSGCVAF